MTLFDLTGKHSHVARLHYLTDLTVDSLPTLPPVGWMFWLAHLNFILADQLLKCSVRIHKRIQGYRRTGDNLVVDRNVD